MIVNRGIPIPAKILTVSHGNFFCKSCNRTTKYFLKEKVERRLIFVVAPILGDILETFIECEICKKRCSPDYLRGSKTEDLKIVEAIKDRLQAGYSAQQVESELSRKGVAEATIKQYLRVAVGIAKKTCVQCGSVYHGSTLKCGKCGVHLST